MEEEIPKLKILNDREKEETRDLLKFYKYIYQCNSCGRIYGADKNERLKVCPVCELNTKRNKK
jgi:rubrerythrin